MKEAKTSSIESLMDLKKINGYYLTSQIQDVNGRESKIHLFKVGEEIKKIWGFSELSLKLENIPEGSKVEISYEGKTSKGEKSYNHAKVLYDDSDKIDANIDLPF